MFYFAFARGLTGVINFDSLDLNRAALFLWINFFFTARSKIVKALDKFFLFGWLMTFFKAVFIFLLIIRLVLVRRRSRLSVLVADLVTGISYNH